jgi:hypothetical protein
LKHSAVKGQTRQKKEITTNTHSPVAGHQMHIKNATSDMFLLYEVRLMWLVAV